MRLQQWLVNVAASAVLVAVSGCTSIPMRLPDTAISSAPFQKITIGLCEDYPEETRSLAAAKADLALLQTNNIRALRIAFGWDAVEPERGKFDWSFWDEFVRMAVDDYGVTLLPYVCYTPRWASTDSGPDFWRAPPANVADFGRFMEQIVSRYKNRIHSWELWNEPDNPAYWTGSVQQFEELVRAGSRAVRKVDPGARVVSGGLAWNLEFLRELSRETNAIRSVDVVNLHNYYETWSSDPLEKLGDHINRAVQILRQSGATQAVWLAEVGYSSYRSNNFVSAQYIAQFPFEHTERYQAVSVGRAITEAVATGHVPLVAWYRIHDLPETEEIIGDVNNRHLGVISVNGRPKLALQTLRFFEALFAERVRCIDEQVMVLRSAQSDSQVHAFQTQSGRLFVVAWIAAVQKRHADSEQVEVFLSGIRSHSACVYNALGISEKTVHVQRHQDWAEIAPLRLKAGELTVLIIDPKEKGPRRKVHDHDRAGVTSLSE